MLPECAVFKASGLKRFGGGSTLKTKAETLNPDDSTKTTTTITTANTNNSSNHNTKHSNKQQQ
jgi:hypothetical protein